MLRKRIQFDDLEKLSYLGGWLIAILMTIYTQDPLWFIAIFVVDIAVLISVHNKFTEKMYQEMYED